MHQFYNTLFLQIHKKRLKSVYQKEEDVKATKMDIERAYSQLKIFEIHQMSLSRVRGTKYQIPLQKQ